MVKWRRDGGRRNIRTLIGEPRKWKRRWKRRTINSGSCNKRLPSQAAVKLTPSDLFTNTELVRVPIFQTICKTFWDESSMKIVLLIIQKARLKNFWYNFQFGTRNNLQSNVVKYFYLHFLLFKRQELFIIK